MPVSKSLSARLATGAVVGLVGDAIFGAVMAGLVAIFAAEQFAQIGFLGFLQIFDGAGALSELIQWWKK